MKRIYGFVFLFLTEIALILLLIPILQWFDSLSAFMGDLSRLLAGIVFWSAYLAFGILVYRYARGIMRPS